MHLELKSKILMCQNFYGILYRGSEATFVAQQNQSSLNFDFNPSYVLWNVQINLFWASNYWMVNA